MPLEWKKAAAMFYTFAYAVLYPLFKLLYRFRILRSGPVPAGAVLVCANHSHAFDPVFLAFVLGRHARPAFMAKKQLFRNRLAAAVIRGLGAFPVERDSSAATGGVKDALRALKANRPLIIFPEGTRVRPGEQEDAKAGAGMLAVRTGSPILPVYIEPDRRLFRRVSVIVGAIYDPARENGKKSDYRAVSDEIMNRIYALCPGAYKTE